MLRSGPIFLIDGGVCKVDPVAAVVVTEGVDGFPEAVEGVEALNSRSTSLLTFGWFKRFNSARNPCTAFGSIFDANESLRYNHVGFIRFPG